MPAEMTSTTNPVESPTISSLLKPVDRTLAVETRAENYLRYFDSNQNKESVEELRKQNSMDVSNNYYDLATDFYEYGWGQSFHFAVLRAGDSRDHSFGKYEYTLGLKLELKPDDFVLVSWQHLWLISSARFTLWLKKLQLRASQSQGPKNSDFLGGRGVILRVLYVYNHIYICVWCACACVCIVM